MLQSVTKCCRVLQNVTKYYRVFLAHLLWPIFGLVFLQIKLPENDFNVIFFLTKLNGFPKHRLQIILLQDLIWFCYDLLTFMRSQIDFPKKCQLFTGIENKDTTDIDCASVQYEWYHGRSLVNDHRPFGHIFALGSSRSSSMKIGAVANRAAAAG